VVGQLSDIFRVVLKRAIINVPPELHAEWKRVALQREESMSSIVCRLLEAWLSKQREVERGRVAADG